MKKKYDLIIGIGGNINSKEGLHPIEVGKKAIKKLKSLSIHIQKVSSWYISDPIPKSNQPKFFNCIVIGNTFLNENKVLENLLLVEKLLGRIRINLNDSRSIDLDLIDYDGKIYKSNDLVLPHPRSHLRKFVMEPIAEVNPFWVHPIIGLNAKQLSNQLTKQIISIYKSNKKIDWFFCI